MDVNEESSPTPRALRPQALLDMSQVGVSRRLLHVCDKYQNVVCWPLCSVLRMAINLPSFGHSE